MKQLTTCNHMKRFNSYALKKTVTARKFKDKIKDILPSDPGEGAIIDTGGIEERWQQFQENLLTRSSLRLDLHGSHGFLMTHFN